MQHTEISAPWHPCASQCHTDGCGGHCAPESHGPNRILRFLYFSIACVTTNTTYQPTNKKCRTCGAQRKNMNVERCVHAPDQAKISPLRMHSEIKRPAYLGSFQARIEFHLIADTLAFHQLTYGFALLSCGEVREPAAADTAVVAHPTSRLGRAAV